MRRVVRHLIPLAALAAMGCVRIPVAEVRKQARITWEPGESEQRFRATLGLDERVVRMTDDLAQLDRLRVETLATDGIVFESLEARPVRPRDRYEARDEAELYGLRDRCDDDRACVLEVVFRLERTVSRNRTDELRIDYVLTRTEIRGLPGRIPHGGEVDLTVRRLVDD